MAAKRELNILDIQHINDQLITGFNSASWNSPAAWLCRVINNSIGALSEDFEPEIRSAFLACKQVTENTLWDLLEKHGWNMEALTAPPIKPADFQ